MMRMAGSAEIKSCDVNSAAAVFERSGGDGAVMALRHARESAEALNAQVEEGLKACRQKNLRLWAHPSAMPGATQSVLCRYGPLI